MTKTNGLEYMDTPIDNSGVIPLSELGIGNWREDVSYNPLYIEKQNRTYRTNIGDRVNTHDTTSGISDIGSMSPEELSDALYKTQTGIEMAANALKGMAAIAGTTYISNTLGLGNMLLEGTWDNTVNNYMAELEQEARERNQIYRPTDYDEWSLMQKLGNGVFWADLIQNFGFTVGAGAAAATWAAIPGVGALMSKAPKIVQMAAPSLLSSAGEASIEAIHHKNEETQRKQQTALQTYTKDLNNALTKDAADEITSQFQKTIFDIEEDERKAGNFIFGANLALLTASNTIQFGDIFSRGFSTGRRIANSGKRAINSIAGEAPEQLAKESVGWAGVKGTAKGLVSQLSEASEEVSQGIIQKAASLNEDYDSFNGSKFNPEKREEVTGIMQSLIAASAEAMHDPNTAVEAAMGFLTGALGMPRLKKSLMPVKLEGGIVGSVLEEVNKTKFLNNTIDLINAKLADSKTTNDYYEGLVRHLAYQDKEDLALEEGNHKKFADANSAKFISDVVMFDRVGRLDLLENIINTAGSLSDEDITSLIEETSKNGNGAFSQNGNPMGISEVRSILSDRTKSLKEKITEYKDAKDKLLVDFPSLNEDSLEEALFYKMQTSDLDRRNVSMGKELYNIIKSVAQKEASLKTEDNVDLAGIFGGATESTIWNKLYSNNKELLSKLNEAVANPAYNVTLDTINQIQNLIDDHAANNEDIFNYISSFNELIATPNKANKKHEAFKSKLANKEKAAEIRNQKVATVETVQNTNTGELAEGILDGSFDFDSALSAIHDVGAESSTSTTQKLEEAKNIANAARNQIGTSTKQGLIDKVDGGSDEAKADAKSFVLYATKNVGIRRDLLNTSTYANMTLPQIAEALGLDVNTLSPQDLENLEETLEARSIAALDVLRQSLEIGNAHIEEAEGMAISITPPAETHTVSRSEITPVQSVPNNDKRFKTGKKILGVDVGGMTVKEAREALQVLKSQGNPQETIEHQESILKEMMDDKDNDYTPSRTESIPSATSTKPISGTWTPGYPYFYRGEDPKYKGLTSSQIIENKIQTLRSSDSLTPEQETDLSLLEKEAEVRNFLEIDNRVATVARQAKVQVGTKLNFMVKPEFPTTVFITVLDEGGNHTIVGALGPSQTPSVLRRYRKKGTPATTYIESNVSEVTKKYIGSLNYRTTKIPLSEITKEKFKLAVDLSSEGDEYADIRTLADSRKETKTESERNIRPPKKGKAGTDYVLVKTSLKGEGEYITAGLDSIFYKVDDNVAPAAFLRDVQNAVIPLERKLDLIQEILNIDIKPNGISMTTEGGQVSYLVRSKGKGQNKERTVYGTISGDPTSIVSQILDLVSGKVKYTVSRKYINSTIDGRDYNQMMASVLITNLNSLETLGDFFNMKSVFEDGTPTVGKELDRIKPAKSNTSITTEYTGEETPDDGERQIVNKIKDYGLMPVYKALSPEVQKQFIDYLLPKASAIRTRFINQKLGEAKAKSKEELDDFILVSITPKKAKLRIASNSTIPSLNIDEEVAWIEKVLPQVSREDRMRIVKGLIKIAHKDTTEMAWGMFKDGLIYISDNAASGTVYHEAFHLVVDTLLNKKETKRLFEEAKKIYKSDDLLELEERMAEDFRKYVSYNITEQKGWLKSLWEKLKHLVKYLSGKLTYLDHIYFNIHNGVYKRRKVKDFLEARYRKLTSDDLLSTNDAITSRRIINAHTINKTLSDRAKAVMKNKNAKALYHYSDLESMFADIPNYQEVVRFVEYRGKYKPEFYFDLATKTAAKEAINLTEEILSEEENGKYDISITDYLAERARLEAELAKYTEEEKEYESYEEQLFREREQRLEVKLSFDNLSEDIKSLIQNTKKLTSAEYSALSTAEKTVLLHCLGL